MATNSLLDQALNPLTTLVYIAFPKTQNRIPALVQVCILRIVERYAPTLALVEYREAYRVAVPVVPVELNDKLRLLNKSVNTELIGDQNLSLKANTQRCQYGVTRLFKFVRRHTLLLDVLRDEASDVFRVVITASDTAIFSRVINEARRRDENRFTARLADKRELVSRLPLVIAIGRTKTRSLTPLRDVKQISAKFTRSVNAVSFRQWLSRRNTASVRTIFRFRAKERFATLRISNVPTELRRLTFCGHFGTPVYALIIPQLSVTQKPVALFRYLIRTYTQPGEMVLDPCVGSGTTAIAAREEGRNFICGDSSAEYVEVARKRLAAPYALPLFSEIVTPQVRPYHETPPLFAEMIASQEASASGED